VVGLSALRKVGDQVILEITRCMVVDIRSGDSPPLRGRHHGEEEGSGEEKGASKEEGG
jgi:hypothetical protein